MPKTVLILRGIPGAGKSTLTKELLSTANAGITKADSVGFGGKVRTASADHFFETPEGYKFDPSKIGLAHQACFRDFLYHVQNDPADVVIVDNTCTTIAEIAPYVLAGESHGFNVKIITLRCDPKVAAARNVHGVPAHAVERMAVTLDEETKRIPPWWNHEIRG